MTATLIVDCSMAMAWCFADERTSVSDQVQDRMVAETILVPAHWFLEVSNVLAMAEKRGRISAADSSNFVQLLAEFSIEIDDGAAGRAFNDILPLCRSQRLASLDQDLMRAARQLGIEVIGE
ncbi:MAG: type II toxin-antitoxin system VapC family toxin [Planctomycetota bacterium]|nr:type II toxin-antitoxin system VapC family toxin [Planctomycetota bacterium]